MDIADIRDQRSFENWLKESPVDDAVLIAVRVAPRVFPLFGRGMDWVSPRKHDLTALPVLRSLLTSGCALRFPNPEIKAAAATHVAAAAAYAASLARGFVRPYGFEASAPADAAAAAGARNAARTVERAEIAARYSAARGAADMRFFWEEIREDARLIADGQDPFAARLWSIPPPSWFTQFDAQTRSIWAKDPPGTWDFWLRWWEGVLSGNQVNWDLQRDIVLELTEEDWTAGPARVAERIAEIEVRFAIAATPNAETMQINPETGRLRLVPDSDLSADILTYAGRKIARAVALFGLHPANQYTAIAPELAMLREAQADASNLPVELFDVCASVSRRVTLRVTNGECPGPEQDAVVADFLSRIREAGADILANDPKTQDVLSRRNAILGNTALVEGKAALVEVSNKIATLAEGRLATALPLDATLATDPETNIADIKDASFRLTGRLLRFSKFVAVGVGSTGGAVIALKEVLEAIPAIQASPIFQQAMQYVLRYLGF